MRIRVLVPVNDSETSDRTIEAIVGLKSRFSTCDITLLHVVDLDKMAYRMIPDFQIDMVRDRALKSGEKLLQKAVAALKGTGVEADVRLETGSPRRTICQIANDEDFQLLVIGRRGTGEIRDVLFGSVANFVLHNVECPVLLI